MSYSRWMTLLSADAEQQVPVESYERWQAEAPKVSDYADWQSWLPYYQAWTDRFLATNGLELSS